jgi:hypothetical protein
MIKNRISLFLAAFLIIGFFFLALPEKGWAQEATFNCTENTQSFMVPNGVISIHIQAWGAEGGTSPLTPPVLGGLGGFAEGDLAVTPGQTLDIFVGCQGCTWGTDPMGGCGGFNGGGNAGADSDGFGGGGGASDVRVGGINLTDRVIVAAGGGGVCDDAAATGGDGGGLVGGNGGNFLGQQGLGGTQNSGGAVDAGCAGCLAGEFGLGGSGMPVAGSGSGGGGGGGGWYGGGNGCGGGGGSSYIGGVDNGTTTSGVREGNGMVVLTWTPQVVTPIPTLSEWGLIAMAGILGIVGFMILRRRKVSA